MSKKGFSLIEVIAAVAIIGILSVPVLNIFTTSFRNVISSGKRTKKVFHAQKEIDKEILAYNSIGTDSLILSFKKNDTFLYSKVVQGKIIRIESDNPQFSIATFVPNK